ncbi:MAG: ATP-dependent helicase, RecQ family [Verrucomicrobiales bacterium]|nr:ATP-dependent helicase, RecQ family [Verrucomicrobiales bacterium]
MMDNAEPPPAPEQDSPLLRKARRALKKHFGHSRFRPGQEDVISRLLEARSTLALLPTGGGKSLCYQVPALILPGCTLVISPLLALMRDQVETLLQQGIAAARLDSTLSQTEQESVLSAFTSGKLKMLYLSPERFLQPACLAVLRSRPCPLIAIDEAHCLVEWGHNFRPDYLRLASLPTLFPGTPLLALTATATPDAVQAICQAFDLDDAAVVRTSMARPNLRLHVAPTAAKRRLALLRKRLDAAGRQPAIVYVTRQETAESVSTFLQREGIAARAYHAGLPDDQRSEAQDAFLSGQCTVIVATTAFGMGIDLSNVRAVFHFDLPRSLENYLQEIGRAGRDGRTAHAEMLASAEDLTVLENFILGDTPTTEALRICLDSFLRQGPAPSFSRWQLSRHADVRPAVLDTLLARLEMAGLISPGPSSWLSCRVKLLRREESLTAGHPPREQAWIRYLLVKREKVWGRIPVDLVEAATALETTPEILAEFLRELELSGDLTVRPRERQETWFLTENISAPAPAPPPDPAVGIQSSQLPPGKAPVTAQAWTNAAIEAMQRREQSARRRLADVVDFFEAPGCLVKRLTDLFGEPGTAACGQCTRCRNPGKPPIPLPVAPPRDITLDEAEVIRMLVRQRLPALRHPRQLTRFLCGISSPATQRDRLTKHDAFGLLLDVPFDSVLTQAEASA